MTTANTTHTGPTSKLVGVNKLAEQLGMSAWQVRSHARAGAIPFYRIGNGRFRFDLNEVLARLRQSPTT